MFGYMIGMVLFAILYLIGMRIMEFIDPYPPRLPRDREQEETDFCEININGKTYKCLKTTNILYSYGYSADCDVLEYEMKHIRYELENPIKTVRLDEKIIVKEIGKSETECYISNDGRNLVSYNPICYEKVLAYRKPWKNKLSA